MKLGVIAGLHAASGRNFRHPERRGEYAGLFLKRALRWMEISGWPDALLVIGNCLDPAGAADHAAFGRLKELTELLSAVPIPVMMVRGEGDMSSSMFYGVVPQLPDFLEIGGARIVPFETPGGGAWSSETARAVCAKFDRARDGFSGTLIGVHSGCGRTALPALALHDSAAAEILRKMEHCGCVLSIEAAGDAPRPGTAPQRNETGGVESLSVPSFVETPFRFAEITLEADGKGGWRTSSRLRELRLPDGFGWQDNHTHSPFAYCCENMDLRREAEWMELFGLSSATVTEHSAHLLFDRDAYWGGHCWFYEGAESKRRIDRSQAFREYFRENATGRFRFGLEMDIDCRGRLVIPESLRPELEFKLGATHFLTEHRTAEEGAREFLFLVESLGRAGVKVLAHPLRILKVFQIPAEPLYDRLIEIMRRCGMAAEVNFHQNSADPEFTRRCMTAGLKLSFGTDAHNLAFFGFLQPQIELVQSLGFNGAWEDLLYTVPER